VVAGLDLAMHVFRAVSTGIGWEARAREGDRFKDGELIASVAGAQSRPIRSPSVRHRITPMVSVGPMWTDPSPTPRTTAAIRTTVATTPTTTGRPRTQAATPDPRSGASVPTAMALTVRPGA